jgi:hypothetical protein
MIPVGQPYRPAGPIDIRAVLTTVILGAFTAVLAAVPIWLWEISPIPTLLIVSTGVQAVLIGAALVYMVGRLRMRTPRLVGVIALACGFGSVVLVHYGHYLYFVKNVADEIRVNVKNDPLLTPERKRGLLAKIDKDGFAMANHFLVEKSGRSGFLGFMQLRNESGITLRRMPISGIFLWLLWGGEALFAAYLARTMATERASQPFCEDCGYWCNPEADLFTLPSPASEPIADAVQGDLPERIDEIRRHPPEDTGPGRVGVTLHACPGCDQAFADVSHRVSDGKKTVTTVLTKHVRVSPEMATSLRYEPPREAQPATEAGDPADSEEDRRVDAVPGRDAEPFEVGGI